MRIRILNKVFRGKLRARREGRRIAIDDETGKRLFTVDSAGAGWSERDLAQYLESKLPTLEVRPR